MKLELKHLAPYLPYRLRMAGCESVMDGIILERFVRGEWDIIPILRPLSDLTKEIEINGDRFVPMRYLSEEYIMKLTDANGLVLSAPKYPIFKCENQVYEDKIHCFCEWVEPEDEIIRFEYDNRFNRFAKRSNTRNRPVGVGHQLEMFQKLFQWHFDVFGLIENNLAININEL